MRVLLLVALLAVAHCTHLRDHRSRHWLRGSRAASTATVSISVALTQRNLDELDRLFKAVSEPSSPRYGKFATKEELRDLVAPSKQATSTVLSQLYQDGALSAQLLESGDFIRASFRVQDVERMLGVPFYHFTHAVTQRTILRADEMYQMPSRYQGLVAVFGLVSDFPAERVQVHSSKHRESTAVPDGPSPDASCSAATPLFGYPQASLSHLFANVPVVCCDGSSTSSTDSLCSDHPPTVQSFVVTVVDNSTGAVLTSSTLPASSVECAKDGSSVSCNVPFNPSTPVSPFGLYNIKLSYEYSDQSTSNTAAFPTALVTSSFVTPQYLWENYQQLQGVSASAQATQAVAEFGEQYYSPTDLNYFLGNVSLDTATPVTLVGPNDASSPGDEATLDIQWIMSTGVGAPTTFWSIANPGYLLEWAVDVGNSNNPPLVHSISWSGNEAESPREWQDRVNTEFQKLGTLGLSIVVASGDAGVTDVGHGSDSCKYFEPQFPSTSPYVTSVSATYFTSRSDPICYNQFFGATVECSATGIGEVGVSADRGMDWTTGGGFSNVTERQSWQDTAVSSFLASAASLPPSSYFNASGRAYPDVSAIGHNLLIIMDREVDIADGTSAATPIFAGILTMINSRLIEAVGHPIGFANPLLYTVAEKYPSAFYDVTVGDNKCGDVLHPPYVACCDYGFEATHGWDPVTGLGTPRVSALIRAALAESGAKRSSMHRFH